MYYIKERHNPQFDKPCYKAFGNTLTAKEAKRYEDSLYGYNIMLKFSSKKEYEKKIVELQETGFSVAL